MVTSKQLAQVKSFAREYYEDTGQYHDWKHVELVRRDALLLARGKRGVDRRLLEAACYLHDIGRKVKDEGHPYTSAKLARPFLTKIGLGYEEVEVVIDAVYHHDKEDIRKSKTREGRLLFDADKLQILTVYGFLRVSCFLADERAMKLTKAVEFVWKYVNDVRDNYLQTRKARKIVNQQWPLLERMVKAYLEWEKR